MTNAPKINLLFPIPVMTHNIGRSFTENELQLVDEHLQHAQKNQGNLSSKNIQILEEKEFLELKKICLDYVDEYINITYKPKFKVQARITLSWLNWTQTGEYHHEHDHPNSFISGVLYINTGKQDKITFVKPGYQPIKLSSDHYDICNSESWWFNVGVGDIILFPSSLRHKVDAVTENETRISLAFNTFLTGTLGDEQSLTVLELG
jgi:uncharacterized protein (TIGR02466 family)